MKHSALIIIGVLLLFGFSMQVLMFYRIHEKLDQRFALEKRLDLSSREGSDSWTQDSENWTPYQELFQLRDQTQRTFDNALSRLQKMAATSSQAQIPAVDVQEEPDRYVVTADIPGADESSLDLALDGRQLTIAIKSDEEKTDEKGTYQLHERFHGEVKRTLQLPGEVDPDSMKTTYDKGVLRITLTKA